MGEWQERPFCLEGTRRRVVAGLIALALMAGICPADAAPVRSAIVSLALWDSPVFRSEASGAARVLKRRYGGGGPVIVRANTRKNLAAGPRGMMKALAVAERGMRPAEDVLFLVLTSHGSPDGIAEKGTGMEGLLPPRALAQALAQSAFRKKVLIVSACYSGIYTTLANSDTLVITAADATHPSFGCEEGNTWTYFGDAFFNRALGQPGSLAERFAEARELIRAREEAQRFEPSNPQLAGGENVLAVLDAQ